MWKSSLLNRCHHPPFLAPGDVRSTISRWTKKSFKGWSSIGSAMSAESAMLSAPECHSSPRSSDARAAPRSQVQGSQAWIRSFHPMCWHAWRAGHRSFMATKTSKKIGSKDISNAASSKFERCQKPLIRQNLRFSDSPGSIPITTWLSG